MELKKLHTMKKTTFLKIVLLIFVFLQHFNSYSQNYIPFAPRYNQDIKGFPKLIFANMFGFKPVEYFEAQEAAKQVPQVDFK